MKSAFFFFYLFFIFSNFSSFAQKNKKVSLTGIIIPARTPEYGWYLNGGAIGLFKTKNDSLTRTSNIYLFGLYSQQKQWRISLGGDVFFPKEKLYVYAWFYRSYLPEYYFGIGGNLNADTYEIISYRIWHLESYVFYRLKKGLFAGIAQQFDQISDLEFSDTGRYASDKPIGYLGYTASGIGPAARLDRRDNIYSSRSGIYAHAEFIPYGSWLGSTLNFQTAKADLRYFHSLDEEGKKVWANQVYGAYASANAPFRMLASMTTRAFHPNLYRGHWVSWWQSEFRWRFWKGAGFSAFGGISSFDYSQGLEPAAKTTWNAGLGLRWRLIAKDNLHIRVEYGVGSGSSNFYVSFSDAF
jgi:hypothetical protein